MNWLRRSVAKLIFVSFCLMAQKYKKRGEPINPYALYRHEKRLRMISPSVFLREHNRYKQSIEKIYHSMVVPFGTRQEVVIIVARAIKK